MREASVPDPNPHLPAAVTSAPRNGSRWRVGELELDEGTLELRLRGEVVAIERKPLELLMWLLRHPGEVLTKEELFDALWTDRVVTDSVLTKCVAKLRLALGDDGQSILKTVHGFGYRLVAPVERLDAQAGSLPAPDGTPVPQQMEAPPPEPAALQVGDSPPQRPNWRLQQRFAGSRGNNWLAVHVKSGEKRVFKFGLDAKGLSQIKREVTLNRLLRDTLGPRDDLVRVLDWNLEEAPYFVELDHCSQGSLLDWLAAQGGAAALPLALRLELVAQTADALAAAHSAGVLHKDVKPGNVMIELDAAGAPRVRLGDFGSARVLDAGQLQALQITRMGFTQTLAADASTSGTWAYMAPEVVAGQPPTARSDVFSLGVLLYQLAVGDLRKPLAPGWERELDDALLREDVAACCDQEPARRLGDAAEVGRRLRTLDMRRETRMAQQRAATAAQATQESLRQARTRRRWLTAVTGVSLTVAFVTGALYLQVERARAEAERQTAAARSVNDFLVQDLLGAANPLGGFGAADLATPNSGQVPVRELLDRAAARAGERFSGQPALESAVRSSLGHAYHGLSAAKEAAREHEAAARLAATLPLRDRAAEAQALFQAGMALTDTGEVGQAEARLAQAQQLLGEGGIARSLGLRIRALRAFLLLRRGDAQTSMAQLRTLSPQIGAAFGANSPELADHFKLLAEAERQAGQLPESLGTAQRAHDLTVAIYGAEHPRSLLSGTLLAVATGMVGRWAEAEALLRRQHALGVQLLGEDHLFTLHSQAELASAIENLGRHAEALPLLLDAVTRRVAIRGEMDGESAMFINNLGVLYSKLGRLDDAFETMARFHRIVSTVHGPDHTETLLARHQLARLQQLRGRWAEARQLQQDLVPRARQALGAEHWRVGVVQDAWARTLHHFGERREARANAEQALTILVAALGEDHDRVKQARTLLAELSAPAAP